MSLSFILIFICCTGLLSVFFTLGDQYSLKCLNDYQSIIICSLNISTESPGDRSPYWLHFSAYDEHFQCPLERRDQSLLCLKSLSSDFIFTDTDNYSISLRSGYHGSNFSVVLDGNYMPKNHIRPLAPCNLSLLWDQAGAVVRWESGYDPKHLLAEYLQYQLRLNSKNSGTYEVVVMELKVFVEESRFKPYTNYTICVRSKPNEEYYTGVWSQWTPALHWRSGNIIDSSPESSLHTSYLLVLISPVLLICLLYRCRKQEHVPSPASFLKDWKVETQIHMLLSGKGRDIMQGEESLQIDILTENGDTPPQQSTLNYEMMEVTNEHEPTLQSPSMLHSAEGLEVDSDCWIRDVMATERKSIIKGYCTLSSSTYKLS